MTKEPLVVVLPSDHRLAGYEAIDPHDVRARRLSACRRRSRIAVVIDDFLKRLNLDIKPDTSRQSRHGNVMVAVDTRHRFLPAYARNFLPWSVISRPIKGDAPTIDLVIGHHRANASPTLNYFCRDWTS